MYIFTIAHNAALSSHALKRSANRLVENTVKTLTNLFCYGSLLISVSSVVIHGGHLFLRYAPPLISPTLRRRNVGVFTGRSTFFSLLEITTRMVEILNAFFRETLITNFTIEIK